MSRALLQSIILVLGFLWIPTHSWLWANKAQTPKSPTTQKSPKKTLSSKTPTNAKETKNQKTPKATKSPQKAHPTPPAKRPDKVKTKPTYFQMRPKERIISYENKNVQIQLTNYGGGFIHYRLMHYINKKQDYLDLLAHPHIKVPTYTERFKDKKLLSHGVVFYSELDDSTPEHIRFQGRLPVRSGGYLQVEKTYAFIPGSYRFTITYKLTNRSKSTLSTDMTIFLRHVLASERIKLSEPDDSLKLPTRNFVCSLQDKGFQRIPYQRLPKDKPSGNQDSPTLHSRIQWKGPTRYMGVEYPYFLMALLPEKPSSAKGCMFSAGLGGWLEARQQHQGKALSPKESHTFQMTGYFGPKSYQELTQLKRGVDETIDLGGWSFLAKPFLMLMNTIHQLLQRWGIINWGFAIILLAIFFRLLLWPLRTSSLQVLKKLNQLDPEIRKLREEYSGQPKAHDKALRALYAKHKVQPAKGCLPFVIQIVLWVALYTALKGAAELYQAPFVARWIDDLSVKDPLFIFPLTVGILTYLQQKMTFRYFQTKGKLSMLFGVPSVMFALTVFLPAGLGLHFIVDTMVDIVQIAFQTFRDKLQKTST